ncbi:MAG: S8 family serine peptidase [Candidatus Omnitrophica bacterium]|nr:S8 family serine peptidase [Candidatus Omnitrophota bacterium]
MYIEPEERLDTLKQELVTLSEGHNSWYWQLDKNSDEYKKCEEKLAAEKKDLEDQIKKQAETVARFEAYNEKCINSGSTAPNLDRIYLLKFDSSIDPKQLADIYKTDPAIEYAHPNYITRVNMIPNDPYYASSGAWKQSFRDLWGIVKIQADKAWDTTQGQGIIVAVSDTGVDYNHPDLKANMWKDKDGHYGYNFVSDNFDPMDDFGHGTHCAGTIAAVGNNNIGIIGVAPKAKIMAVKGLDNYGSGTIDALAQTIQYAADNGADVISCSWGGRIPDTYTSILDAVRYATNIRNSVVVAAAGNENSDVDASNTSPANIKEVITVAASNSNDEKAYFTNYGAKIDVAAPGGGDKEGAHPERSILSLKASLAIPDMLGGKKGPLVIGGNYLRQAGTSMACPHVSGVAALIKSMHRDFTPEQVRQVIRAGSDDILTNGFDDYSGYGRVNAYGAISLGTPLVPVILEPSLSQYDNAETVPIKFMITGNNVASWKIEYCDVARTWDGSCHAGPWKDITQGAGPVNTPATFDWDVRTVTDGIKRIRITATDSNGKIFQNNVTIKNNHITITKPENPVLFSFYRPGNNVVIEGTINPCGFTYYSLEIYRLEDSNSQYSTSGKQTKLENPAVTLPNDGKSPVVNGRIAEWDITNIPMGYYKIYLLVHTPGVSITRLFRIVVDPSLHQGWPIKIPVVTDGSWTMPPVDIFTSADINGDGREEILLNYNGQVNVMDHTGASLPGWPKTFAADGDISQNGVTVGDVMGTGRAQVIVATCGGQIHLFDSAGKLIKKFPDRYRSGYGLNPSVAVADIDMDGKNEMVITAEMSLYVVDRDGEKWSEDLSKKRDDEDNCLFQPTVADLDGNGEKEIIVQAMLSGNRLYIFDCKGDLLNGWPKRLCSPGWDFYSSAPIAADIDKDGITEIITIANNNTIHVLKPDGTEAAGWPREFDCNTVWGFRQVKAGDLDGDGSLEIVAGGVALLNPEGELGIYDILYVFRSNGTIYSKEWPIYDELHGIGGTSGFASPVLADVNNDGKSEIVVSGKIDMARGDSFHAYDLQGNELMEFHKPVAGFSAWYANCPAIGDFSGGGKNQILWLARSHVYDSREVYNNPEYCSATSPDYDVYLWDTDTPSTNPKPWPMFHRDPQHAGTIPTGVASPFKAPSDLCVTAVKSTVVNLSWKNNSALTTDFEIERKAGLNGKYARIDEIKAKNLSYNDKNLVPGTTYYYRVRAVRKDVYYSRYSNEISITAMLPAPSGLTATVASSAEIDLSWTDNSNDERKFIVERKTGANGKYAEIHRTIPRHAYYKDKTPATGTTYYYRVRAINKTGHYSEYSNEASATTLLPAPSGLTAYTVSKSVIAIYWKDNAGDAKNFLIERKTGAKGAYAQIHKTGPKDTDYRNTQLSRGTTYYYRVRVINKNGCYSGYSNEASATTKTK